MSYQEAIIRPEPIVLATGEGEHLHFLNHLATIKARGRETGSLSVVEFMGPRGFGPPLHSHDHEDELFVVLEGDLVLRSGDIEVQATAGATAFLPHGRPHTFQVLSESARFTCITTSRRGAPEFDEMVSELGIATLEPTLPTPTPIDPGRVAAVNRAHGIEILGPPPGQLDDNTSHEGGTR